MLRALMTRDTPLLLAGGWTRDCSTEPTDLRSPLVTVSARGLGAADHELGAAPPGEAGDRREAEAQARHLAARRDPLR